MRARFSIPFDATDAAGGSRKRTASACARAQSMTMSWNAGLLRTGNRLDVALCHRVGDQPVGDVGVISRRPLVGRLARPRGNSTFASLGIGEECRARSTGEKPGPYCQDWRGRVNQARPSGVHGAGNCALGGDARRIAAGQIVDRGPPWPRRDPESRPRRSPSVTAGIGPFPADALGVRPVCLNELPGRRAAARKRKSWRFCHEAPLNMFTL